jgi:soluble P-type ATPase
MLNIPIPDRAGLTLAHLILDFNGTLAVDGVLLPGVGQRLEALAARLKLHVLTGDMHGSVASQMRSIPCQLTVLQNKHQSEAKCAYAIRLGAAGVACIGNGKNDQGMLEVAALGIAVMETEGCAMAALISADLCARSIVEALDLLLHPQRIAASLRW